MNTNKKIMAIITAGALAVGALAGCSSSTGKNESDVTDATDAGVNVSVSKAMVQNVETTATYTGDLVTENVAYVTSKVSAKVERVNVELGDWVNAGETLVVLDSSDFQFQKKQAQTTYDQAEASYNSALVAYNNVDGANQQTVAQLLQAVNSAEIAYNDAKTNFERQTELYEKGSISLVTYESAKSAFENATIAYEGAKNNYDIVVNTIVPGNVKSAQSGVSTAQAALDAAKISIENADRNIANTVIKAPISGYVSAKNVAVGQFASAGVALFTISDSSNLNVEIKVTESVIPHVKVGGKAKVTVSSAGIYDVETTVSMVNPVKDAVTGMYIVRVAVPNEENTLKVGMFADVTLITEQSAEDAVSILSQALILEGDKYYVYVVEDNFAEKRYVTIGVSDGEYTQITEGIEEGETVVTQGKEYLSESNNYVNIVD